MGFLSHLEAIRLLFNPSQPSNAGSIFATEALQARPKIFAMSLSPRTVTDRGELERPSS